MIEKRFTLAYEKGNWWAVRDGEITLWKEEVITLLNDFYEENEQLKKDNKELRIRNNNQATRLSNIYFLIEKKDWATLTGLIQEFQECEEQLKREEYTYYDMREEEVMEGKDE